MLLPRRLGCLPPGELLFSLIQNPDGTIFSLFPLTTVNMKLLLLLVAIYSLIFYQHYKIEKYKSTVSGSEPKAEKSYKDDRPGRQQDYGNTNFVVKSRHLLAPELRLARLGFYE